jgi:SAM-dependent methyltransferase
MASVRFDRAVGYYDATRGFAPGVAERIREAIRAAAGAGRATRFLELGVGTGRIALPFLRAGDSYVGIDLSRPMLQVLRDKLPAGARPPVVEGDVTRLPFAGGQFDVLLAVHVLHLVGDWRATLAEAQRVLRRPGLLLLAGETGGFDQLTTEAQALPPVRAQRAWGAILDELGHPSRGGQPGVRPTDPAVQRELERLGATVEQRDLAPYARAATSARQVLQAFRDRIYSSDWARPDDVHAAAVARLEQWLAAECADPDTPYVVGGQLRAVIARWGQA